MIDTRPSFYLIALKYKLVLEEYPLQDVFRRNDISHL